MSIQAEWCLLTFAGLFAASVIMQWIRARKRKSLVQATDPSFLSPPDQEKWNAVNRSFDFLFKDFRKLQLIRKNKSSLSGDEKLKLELYCRFSRMEICVTVSMLIFALSAHWICD